MATNTHLIIGSLVFTLLSIPVKAAEENKAVINIPYLSEPPELSNFIQMQPTGANERQMARVSGFIQRTPRDGELSTQHTEVYLSQDNKNLYVIFIAFDTEPGKVRAHLNRRENVEGDDIVEIMLDTFNDKRRAYAFVANPLGVQWDGIWTEGSEFDGSFDTLWHSEGRLTEQGYVVKMAIPFKSLRFPSAPEQTWGVIFLREILRGNAEQAFWPQVSSRIEGRLNQSATLRISKNISPGLNIQLIPYGSYRTFRLLDEQASPAPKFNIDSADPDAGLDAKFVLQDNWVTDVTLNPDFSQVESDEPQVTLNQRFEVFFPEKRPFFLENAGFFQTPISLVFTRRIAEPQLGARVTGKAGPYAVGVMLMDDAAQGKIVPTSDPQHGKRAMFGIARVSRDIFKQSNVGLIYTDREFQDTYNRVLGFDSRLKLNQNLVANLQAIRSYTKETSNSESVTGNAFSIFLDHSGRHLETHFHYLSYEPDFITTTGFVPRTDIRDSHHLISYNFWPEKKYLVRWGPEFFVEHIWDLDGTFVDDIYESSLEWEFTGQTQFEINYTISKERLRPVDYPALTQKQAFDWDYWKIEYETQLLNSFEIEGDFIWGNAINFEPVTGLAPQQATMINSELEFILKPVHPLRIDNTYIFFRLNDHKTGSRVFTNQILRTKWNWQLNRKLSFRLIFQYDVTTVNPAFTALEKEKNFNIDFLFTYLVNPWTALYIGVNSNYQNLALQYANGLPEVIRTNNDFLNDGRQFFIKYSYLFRL